MGNTFFKSQNWQMAIKKYTKVLRYVEGSRAAAEDADGAKLQPVTSSCVLNISTSKRKMSDQQGAVDSCLEALEIDPSNTKALWSPRMARIKKNMFKHWLVLRKLRR